MDHEQGNGTNRKAVYTIVEGTGDKQRWVRVGIAFVNRDGSYNVLLDALPANGELHIRDFPPRDSEAGAEESPAPATAAAGRHRQSAAA